VGNEMVRLTDFAGFRAIGDGFAAEGGLADG
jgi:hypothetical protein